MNIERLRTRGAEAVLVEEPGFPLTAVNVRVATGSRDDFPDRHGLAHVVEHRMLSGTDAMTRGAHARAVERMGGFLNAKTSADWTAYSHVVPSELAETVLGMEAVRFSAAARGFPDTGLSADREIVLRERDQRLSPAYGDAIEILLSAVYAGPSPYGHLPVGTAGHVADITAGDCRDFFRTHYVSSNVSVALAGGFDPDTAREAVVRVLEAFRDEPPPDPSPPGPFLEGTARLEIVTAHPDRIFLGIPLPPLGDPELDLSQLALVLLARGVSGVLNRRLIAEADVAQRVALRTVPRHQGWSMGVIELVPRPGVAVDEVLSRFDAVMESLAREGVDAADADRARAVYQSSWAAEDDSLMQRADGLTAALQIEGTVDGYFDHLDRVAAVTPDGFRRAVGLWHRPGSRVEAVYRR